jgi:sporadic carbohydrate cluster 2OG-Fe(II) oxygenase
MKNSNKDHLSLLKKGYLIKPVENKKSLNYINVFFKKRLLKEKNFKKIKKFNFNNLHKYIPVSELNEVRLKLIKEMNLDKKFRNHLFLLAKKNLYEMVGNELAMQNNINLSIQFPNDESSLLPLHADTWSGDSPFETVVWLPLVDCYKTKSMFILSQDKYEKFTNIYKKKKAIDVSDLFKKLRKDLNFIKINYGNYLFFNQSLPHGNIVNKTKETRISINCRFKGLFTPYAEKKLGKFFSPLNVRPASQIGLDYKFPGE